MSKARSTGNIGNIIKTNTTCVTVNDGTTDLLIMSGSGTVTIPGNLVVLGGIAGSSAESSSYSLSSSFATNANTLDGIDGASFLQTGSFNTFSSSIDTTIKNKLNSDGVISGSVQVDITNTTGYSTFSSSLSSSIGSLSGSVATTTNNLSGRITTIEGNYATTGSNAFIGTQTITGSLYISSDLVVQGSSSLQNITASAVNIGANIVNLNTANPAIRFAGLNIFDSGSIGGSGSFLYDAVQDEFIFVHRGDNTNITSSVVMMGPQTYNNVGSELYPTANQILKGTGNEHVGDSCIFDNGTTVCVNATLKANGQVCSLMGNFSCIGIGMISPASSLHIIKALGSDVINIGESGTGTRFAIGQEAGYTGNYINSRNIDLKLQAYCAGGSGGNIHLQTGTDGGGCVTTKMFICSTGNVGIGTSTPLSKLTIVKSTRSSTLGASSVLQISDASAAGQAIGDRAEINFYTNSDSLPGNLQHATIGIIKTDPNGNEKADLYFGTSTIGGSPVERMRITSAGNVGVGTCAPFSKLSLPSGTGWNGGLAWDYTTANSSSKRWWINTDQIVYGDFRIATEITQGGGTISSAGTLRERFYISACGNIGIGTTGPTTTISGDETTLQIANTNVASVNLQSTGAGGRRYSLASLGAGGQFAIFDSTAGSYRLQISCTGALSVIAPNHMQFTVKSSTSGDARLEMGAEDNVIIGMSMYTAANDISWFIGRHRPGAAGITDEMNLYRGQTNLHRVQNNGNYSFAGSNVSDVRLKENIQIINYNATEKLLQLAPVSYNMIEHPTIHRSGFIAQEVKKILPNFIHGTESENEYLGIDYNGILTLAVKAIQEQQCTINTLKTCLGIN